MNPPDLIASAIQRGTIHDDDSRGSGWRHVQPEVVEMLGRSNGRTTLFLGAAASSLKPTHLPSWDKFIYLLCSSVIDQAISEIEVETRSGVSGTLERWLADALRWGSPTRLPNYKVTETIARRLGNDYLSLLHAFQATKGMDEWVVNPAHEWAAECLMTGAVNAVVTTNFDDCIERALENASANVYRLTGDPHIDGAEIFERARPPSERLILVVSGPRACNFAQTLLPHVGKSAVLLLKLHGSCYAPDTCIDTRLQRQQGLPSFTVDILDYLLVQTVFFIVCFSGGDLNDNTDYLRMIHNRRHVNILWLQKDVNEVEPGVAQLADYLQSRDSNNGRLCFLHGSLDGDFSRNEKEDFDSFMRSWCRDLGPAWCKLIILDLIQLGGQTIAQQEALDALGFSASIRQDWNEVVREVTDPRSEMYLRQVELAKECRNTAEILGRFLRDELNDSPNKSIYETLNRQKSVMRSCHLEAASALRTSQSHAQTWVVSALYGVLLICNDKMEAATEVLYFAQNAAYLVGDLQSFNHIEDLLDIIRDIMLTPTTAVRISPDTETAGRRDTSHAIAFIPSLDNVIAKANSYGVPPALFSRALLHRAMLFADGIVINSNVLTNSKVFVDEILFSNNGQLDTSYVDFIHPLIASNEHPRDQDSPILQMHRAFNSRTDYISERVGEDLMTRLDEHFSDVNSDGDRFIHIPLDTAANNYLKWIRRAVSECRSSTKSHLMNCWTRTRIRFTLSPAMVETDTEVANRMIETIIDAIDLFTANLDGTLTRSKLYAFAGLFATVLNDDRAIHQQIKEGLDVSVRERLTDSRSKILQRPWLSGPLCHELFDVPYNWNPIMHFVNTVSSANTLVFLEPHERSSWKFMATLVTSDDLGGDQFHVDEDITPSDKEHDMSALLLGRASHKSILQGRKGLAKFREALTTGSLDAYAVESLGKQLRIIEKASVDVDPTGTDIERLASLSELTKQTLLAWLESCAFIVRRGQPLSRMYEEPRLKLPGFIRIQRRKAS